MIVVHRKELLEQASEKLETLEVPHGVIAPKRIMTGDLVQIASVDTLIRRLNAVQKPDIIIIDEAHHCIKGNKWGKVAAFFNSYLLGVTATPTRTNGDGLGKNFQGYFDTLIKGPSIRELIDNGYLSQPVVYAPPVGADLSGLKSRGGDYLREELEARMDKSQITGDVVKHYQKICPGVPALAFCVSIKHAENVARQFNDAGIPAASIDGTLSNRVRASRIRDLGAGLIKVLTSCEIVSEGTDIPIVTAAILLRPTQSMGLFLQQSGRVLRIHPEKDHSIILDHVNNSARFGLVDEVRRWSLEDRPNKKPAGGGDGADRVRQCPACYTVFGPHRPICPQCGERWIVQSREVDEVDGELKPVSEEQLKIAAEKKKRRQTQVDADSLEKLQELGKEKGYKPNWANHIWKARQEKKEKYKKEREESQRQLFN